tara:strand:- start:278 stop:451 length:174 start_codon:yes stop_codon:yes gene_type:complete
MKVGDKVRVAPMWKYPKADGTIIKITKEYTVVVWEGINGEWHYTQEQSKNLQILEES